MKIKKTTQTVGVVGTVADEYTEDTRAVYNAPYVNEHTSWNLLTTVTGATGVDLSNVDYSELLIVVHATHPNNYPVYGSIVIPKAVLSSTEYRYFDTGSGATSNVSQTAIRVGAITTSVSINGVILANTTLTSSATMQVFYK